MANSGLTTAEKSESKLATPVWGITYGTDTLIEELLLLSEPVMFTAVAA